MNFFLTIAASDTSGGAGIQQDMRVAEKNGFHTLSAITALTTQSFEKVYNVYPVEPKVLSNQLLVLKNYFNITVCKIGVLVNDEQIDIVSDFLKESKIPIVVVDTVFRSSSGMQFLNESSIEKFKEKILPFSTFITPNKLELERLVNSSVNTIDEAIEKALIFHKVYGCGIYIKGGHFGSTNNFYVKEAIVENSSYKVIIKKRHKFSYSHGTGCAFSTAFALFLKQHDSSFVAAKKATKWVSRFFMDLNKNLTK